MASSRGACCSCSLYFLHCTPPNVAAGNASSYSPIRFSPSPPLSIHFHFHSSVFTFATLPSGFPFTFSLLPLSHMVACKQDADDGVKCRWCQLNLLSLSLSLALRLTRCSWSWVNILNLPLPLPHSIRWQIDSSLGKQTPSRIFRVFFLFKTSNSSKYRVCAECGLQGVCVSTKDIYQLQDYLKIHICNAICRRYAGK